MTTLVHSPNPILEAKDRKEYVAIADGSMTIADHLIAAGVDLEHKPHALYHNGKFIPLDDWDSVYVQSNDYITLRAYVMGGGSKSNPLAIIATIALAFVAPALAGAMGFAQGSIGYSIAVGLITAGGRMLIAALFPPSIPKPSLANNPAVSPTYSIAGARNSARRYSPVPAVLGEHKMFPDIDTQPWTVFQGNEQYLHMTFNFGWILDNAAGGLTISDLKIGDTPIDDFDGVDYEWSTGTTGALSLFHTNVKTLDGGELKDNLGWIYRTTPLGTTKIGVDLSGQVFQVDDEGTFRALSCTFQAEYREVGNQSWSPLVGSSATFVWTGSKPKPIRRSYHKNVEQGQYEIRVRKVTADPTSDRQTISMQLTSIRAYRRDEGDYELQKRLAVKIRASGQLNGTIDALNAIVRQNITAYDEAGDDDLNPASQFKAIAKGLHNASGELLFGAGLTNAQLDTTTLNNWGDWCNTHGLECNFVFDQQQTIADMLMIPARLGRGSWSWGTGKLGVVWDEESRPVTQLITMENIISGSFEVQYTSEDLADEIIVTFVNPDIGWEIDTIRVNVPGVTDPVRPVTLDIAGLTDKDQAAKEANLIAARQYYHRRRVTLEMDSEALVSTRGDVVMLTHDLTSWGQSARIMSGTTTQLEVSTPINIETGTQYYCGVRKPDGTIYTVPVTDPGTTGDYTTINLDSPLDEAPGTTEAAQDWVLQFDIQTTPGRRMKIVELVPLGVAGERVKLEMIDDDASYYAAEGGTYNWITQDPNDPNLGQISNIQFSETNLGGSPETARVTVSWNLTQATGADVRWRAIGDVSWTDLGTITGTSTDIDFTQTQSIEVELTPDAIAVVGPTVYGYYTVKTLGNDATNIVVPDVTGLSLDNGDTATTFSAADANFSWDPATATISSETEANDELQDDFFDSYQVDIEESSVVVFSTTVTEPNFSFTKTLNDASTSGPHRSFTIKVYYKATTGQLSVTAASLTVTNAAPAAPSINVISGVGQYWVQIDEAVEPDFAGYYVFASDTSGFTPGAGTVVYKGLDRVVNIDEVEGSTIYVKAAAYDTISDVIGDLNYSTQDTAVVDEQTILEEFGFEGITFQANDPGNDQVSWTAGTAYSKIDGATTSINAGNATWTSGELYIYWIEGSNTLSTTTSLVTAVQGEVILGVYRGGTDFQHDTKGDAFFDGGKLLAQTVGANQVVASGLITQSAQIGTGLITTALIDDAAVTDAKIGNTIQSTNWNATTKAGWHLDKAGTFRGQGITLYNSDGSVLLGAGTGLDWDEINNGPTSLNDISTTEYARYEDAATDAQQALSDAAAAQATADGKIVTYYQTGEPSSGMSDGDLWFDTDDGNKTYRYNGASWVEIQDDDIATAINNAQTAQTTADSKAIVYYQTTAPSGASAGDLWYDTNAANQPLYRYSGSAWQLIADVTGANTAANITGQGTLATKNSVSLTTEVTNKSLANLDATANNKLNAKNQTFRQANQPTAVAIGDIWHDTDDDTMYVWTGSVWDQAADRTSNNTAAGIAGQGSFATLSQINSGNVSTYIANAAIQTAQIGNAQITNAKISAVDAGKITTGYLAAARINVGTLNANKIIANTITTGLVTNNAITHRAQTFTAAASTLSTSYAEKVSKAVTTNGDVFIDWAMTAEIGNVGNTAANVLVRIRRNTTVIATYGAVGKVFNQSNGSYTQLQLAGTFLDTGQSGTITYRIDVAYQAYGAYPATGIQVKNRQITLLTTKK